MWLGKAVTLEKVQFLRRRVLVVMRSVFGVVSYKFFIEYISAPCGSCND